MKWLRKLKAKWDKFWKEVEKANRRQWAFYRKHPGIYKAQMRYEAMEKLRRDLFL